MSFMYKSIGAKHSNKQLSQNNQYVSYAFCRWGGSMGVNKKTPVSELTRAHIHSNSLWHKSVVSVKSCSHVFSMDR